MKLGALQNDGDPRITERNEALTFAQGFLLDPAISRLLLRGGMKTEADGRVGNHSHVTALQHRVVAADGDLQFLGNAYQESDSGDRTNNQNSLTTVGQDTTLRKGNTTFYGHLLYARQAGGLQGTLTNSVTDDWQSVRQQEGILAARHRLNARVQLWGGLLALDQKNQRLNPNSDFSFATSVNLGFLFPAAILTQTSKSSTLEPELRLDWSLRDDPARPNTVTLGVARPRTRTFFSSRLLLPSPDPSQFPNGSANQIISQNAPVTRLYAQWDKRFNSQFSLITQVRHERDKRTLSATGSANADPFGNFTLDAPPVTTQRNRTLPSMVANYRSGKRTNFRLLASRRATDIAPSLFAPVGTLLNTEDQVLFAGLPDPGRNGDTNALQFDFERYLKSGGLVKLFAFHTQGRNVTYDFSQFTNPADPEVDLVLAANALQFDRLRRQGAGVRFEQPIGRGLFARGLFSFNKTTATAMLTDPLSAPNLTPAPFSGQTAPYSPKRVASLGLNYVGENGFKSGVSLNYNGPIFADTFDATATTRPQLGSSTTMDVSLAYEPTVRGEFFITVHNLFDKQQFIFNDIPLQSRRLVFGLRRRF